MAERTPMVCRVAEFARIVSLIQNAPREHGVQRHYAVFAIPPNKLTKIATNTDRYHDYMQQYRPFFVGVYTPDIRAGDLQDDLTDAGVTFVLGRLARKRRGRPRKAAIS